jgi:hypothetical protein
MASLVGRMIRAAKLDVDLYEEVEADTGATGQAMLVVVLSSVAAGIGSVGGGAGLKESQTEADVGQLLRTTGFSSSPGLLRILGILPGLTGIVFLGCHVWMLVAMVIAVRQALDYHGTGRAIAVCLIGWVVQVAITVLVMIFLGN